MKWCDKAIILAKKPFSERALLLTLFTKEFGLVRGLLRFSKKTMFDCGQHVNVSAQARLDTHLPFLTCEHARPITLSDPLMTSNVVFLLYKTLSPHHPYPDFFDETLAALQKSSRGFYVYFELCLLRYLGFGLDLSECAVTHQRTNLTYVSPKTARAVCFEQGLPYHDKLLSLPSFIVEHRFDDVAAAELKQGLILTGYFIEKHFGIASPTRKLLYS